MDYIKLDKDSLIHQAEEILKDEQIGFASKIQYPVQGWVDDEGNDLQLSITLELKNGIGELTDELDDFDYDDLHDVNDDPYIKGSYSGSSLELAILLLVVCWGIAMWALFG